MSVCEVVAAPPDVPPPVPVYGKLFVCEVVAAPPDEPPPEPVYSAEYVRMI